MGVFQGVREGLILMMKNKKNLILVMVTTAILLSLVLFSGCIKDWGLGGEDYRWDVEWITELGNYGPGDFGRKIECQELTRFYKFHVPTSYESDEAIPVVLCFHGGGGYPGAVRYQTDFDEIADDGRFIVVYPAGHHNIWKDRLLFWNDGRTAKNDPTFNDIDDVGFVSMLLDDLATFFNIDENRTYATGISNGAMMCYRLAAELPDRIATIAPVGAQRAVGEYEQMPSRPISIIHFHGIMDEWAPYYGGSPPSSFFKTDFKQPVPETIQSWISYNECPSEPSDTYRIGNATCVRYGPGLNNTEVVLWTLEDGGHTWPGGEKVKSEEDYLGVGTGPINQDISAMELIWEFFEQHLMN